MDAGCWTSAAGRGAEALVLAGVFGVPDRTIADREGVGLPTGNVQEVVVGSTELHRDSRVAA